MLFRAVLATLAAASVVFGAAVPEAEPAPFNPTVGLLPTRVYDEVDQPLTNGERLRRGMAPLPPKMKKRFNHAPGMVAPTESDDGDAPQASPSQGSSTTNPDLSFDGIIKITSASNGKTLGYVADKLTRYGYLTVENTYRSALEVSIATTRSNQKPTNIEITNGDSRAGKYFGGVASQWATNGALGRGQNTFAYVTRTGQTKNGPMSVSNGVKSHTGSRSKSESAIWTVNPMTRQLAATWTNTGSQSVQSKVYYYPAQQALVITADGGSFKSGRNGAVEVHLTIIDTPLS